MFWPESSGLSDRDSRVGAIYGVFLGNSTHSIPYTVYGAHNFFIQFQFMVEIDHEKKTHLNRGKLFSDF